MNDRIPYADYGWVIDTDHTYDPADDWGRDDAGTEGPSNLSPELAGRLASGEGQPFQMLDDDGELYYSGRIVTAAGRDRASDEDEEIAFAPLDDFGTPNAGAVTIKYRLPTEAGGTKWTAI